MKIIRFTKFKNSQSGSILILSILYLGTIVTIILSITAIFLPKIRLTSDLNISNNALSASDSSLEWCLFNQQGKVWPASPPNVLTMSNGATFQIYFNNSLVASCSTAQTPLNHQTVGIYRGVSRSGQINQ